MAKRDLISIDDLSAADVDLLLDTAESFLPVLQRDIKKVPTLRGRTVINMFFESSTRTSTSFDLAAKRLSADTIGIKAKGSAVDKGESLKDTIITLSAYSPDIRGLKVAIVGDILHSRVARSDIAGFQLLGMDVTVIAPPTMMPREVDSLGVNVRYDLAELHKADVIYLLRIQQERITQGANFLPSLREYANVWGVTRSRLRPGQKVMHPGPINRGVEISAAVADDPDTLIAQQVEAGLAVRMAILYRTIVGSTDSDTKEAL